MTVATDLFVELNDVQAQIVTGGATLTPGVETLLQGLSAFVGIDFDCWTAEALALEAALPELGDLRAYAYLATLGTAILNCQTA